MKNTRKLLTVLITVTAVILLMSALSLSSSAAEVETIEVESWSQLRDALMDYNNFDPVEIKLTRDISREFDDYEDFDYGLFAVAGNKTLDLNGRNIIAEVTIGEENAQYLGGNHFPYLFSFYNGNNSLTVKDTSAAGTGKVHYDASLVKAKNYITSPICDIFTVKSGSSLTIDGGTYEVGHVRTDWTTAVYVNGKLFTGNLRTQVYGTVFTVGKDAELTINGGKFIARGGQLISDKTYGGAYKGNVFKKNSTTNSYVTINGGTFYGEGGCDIFDDGSMFLGIKINNAVFLTKGIDNVLFRYGGYDGGNLKKGDMHIMPEMLKPGIENRVIVNGGKNYMYVSTSAPQDFYYNRQDTAIFTYYDFNRQSPEIPADRVTSLLDDIPVGTNRVIAFEEKPLSTYYKALGFDTMCYFVVRDSSNNIIATKNNTGLKQYNLASITTPGEYTVTVSFDLMYDGSVVEKKTHTFIINIYKPCSHTYTTMSNTATCTSSGTLTEVCTKCGESKTSASAKLGHLSLSSDWSNNSTHHWYYCRRCNTVLDKAAHSYISSSNKTCRYCGYNDNCEWGNAMDTEHDDKYHWWPCDTHDLDTACPNNHQLEKELHTVCTLENAGSLEHGPEIEYSCQNGYVCDGCGEYFGETGEHKWVADSGRWALKLPTCTADGYKTYVCEYNGKYDCKGNQITCTATKRIILPMLGHSFDYENPASDTATCTADGIYTYSCTRARCEITATKVSPAKNHSYSEWIVTTAPTCTKAGESTATCIRGCGHTEKMTLDILGHSFDMPETTVKPTCTEQGRNEAACTRDGCTEIQETTIDIDPDAHNLEFIALIPATMTANGQIAHYNCVECGFTSLDAEGLKPVSGTGVSKVKSISLSKTEYTYNGKEQKPSVTVKDSAGKTLKNGTDYKVTYESGRKNPGKYSVRVDFMGKYSGTSRVYYTIAPKVTSKVTAVQSTKAIKLTWNKVTGASGYRVYQYNTKTKKWDSIKTTTATSYKVEKLKAGTIYKFRIKAYKKDDGTIWGDATATFTTATKTATPSITKLTTTKGKASFTWSNVSGESGFQVYYSTKKDSGYKKVTSYKANVLSGSKSKLTSGKTHYFKVRAYIKTDSGTVFSDWSAVKSIKIK